MTNGRVEVITSVERRRRWSSAEKQQLAVVTLDRAPASRRFAREAGIHPGQLYRWWPGCGSYSLSINVGGHSTAVLSGWLRLPGIGVIHTATKAPRRWAHGLVK